MVRICRWFRSLGRREAIRVLVGLVEAELPALRPATCEMLGEALEILRRFAYGGAVDAETVKGFVILTAQFIGILNRGLSPRTCAVCALVEWVGRAVLAPDEQRAAMACTFGLSNARRWDPSCGFLEAIEQMVSEGSGSHAPHRLYAIRGGREDRGCATALQLR